MSYAILAEPGSRGLGGRDANPAGKLDSQDVPALALRGMECGMAPVKMETNGLA